MKQFTVRVRDDFPFDVARVGGRPYTKHTPVVFAEADLTDEIKVSPALLVEEMAIVRELVPDEPAVVPPGESPALPETPTATKDNAGESDTPTQKKNRRG